MVYKILKARYFRESNLWTANDAYSSMLATYRSVFADVHLLHVPDRRQAILITARAPRTITRDTLLAAASGDGRLNLDLQDIVRGGYEQSFEDDAPILIDSTAVHR